MAVTGLHHVSAIVGPPQATVDHYVGRLGLRLVKQTVNHDDPSTYHLYVADGEVRPGSFLTFFPWPDGRPGRIGTGQATATAYAVPLGAIDAWQDVLAADAEDVGDRESRFGASVLALRDPSGLRLELVETPDADGAWVDGPVPADRALGAFHSVTLDSRDPDATARILTGALDYRPAGQEGDRLRFEASGTDRARFVDLLATPGPEPGRMGVGTVHHVAFRVPDDDAESEVRERLLALGLTPTPTIDRTYFRSVYAREPGGILFEIATDPPGFAVDEPAGALGRRLVLPPHLEPRRAFIEARLAPLTLPT